MAQSQKFSADEIEQVKQLLFQQMFQQMFPPTQAAVQPTEQKQEIPTMLTVKEAAERFHLSEYTIRAMIRKHLISSVRMGTKRIFINQDQLISYLCSEDANS